MVGVTSLMRSRRAYLLLFHNSSAHNSIACERLRYPTLYLCVSEPNCCLTDLHIYTVLRRSSTNVVLLVVVVLL